MTSNFFAVAVVYTCLFLYLSSSFSTTPYVHAYNVKRQHGRDKLLQPLNMSATTKGALLEKLSAVLEVEDGPGSGSDDDTIASTTAGTETGQGQGQDDPIITREPFNLKTTIKDALGSAMLGSDNYEAFKRSKLKYDLEMHYLDANPSVVFDGGGIDGRAPSLSMNMGWPLTTATASPSHNMLIKLPFSTPEEQERIKHETIPGK
jgi:hypothetical protein